MAQVRNPSLAAVSPFPMTFPQKAAKTTARRNGQVLNRTHLIALAIHTTYLFLRVLVFRRSYSRFSLLLYALLSSPALAIELFFERGSRPKYNAGTVGNDLRSSGDDLNAKGLTESMWDVLYWTWVCTVLAAALGDWAWWAYVSSSASTFSHAWFELIPKH